MIDFTLLRPSALATALVAFAIVTSDVELLSISSAVAQQ